MNSSTFWLKDTHIVGALFLPFFCLFILAPERRKKNCCVFSYLYRTSSTHIKYIHHSDMQLRHLQIHQYRLMYSFNENAYIDNSAGLVFHFVLLPIKSSFQSIVQYRHKFQSSAFELPNHSNLIFAVSQLMITWPNHRKPFQMTNKTWLTHSQEKTLIQICLLLPWIMIHIHVRRLHALTQFKGTNSLFILSLYCWLA